MALAAGARLGPYEILSAIGAGGMGEVYRARDTRLDRSVAIKILPAELASNPESRQRFEFEARAVSALNHPHICTLFDVGRHDNIDFIVMELLAGTTLAARLTRGPLPFDELLRTAVEILSALDAAHAHGVVHRDLKPSNLMLTKSGAKLLDFGLAKLHRPAILSDAARSTQSLGAELTAVGRVLGTARYMAPEQVEGKDVDARADIFAFGALLYEMATGRKAFEGENQAGITASILAREPAPLSDHRLSVPPAFDDLVRRCLKKDPEERWQSARDVLFYLQWMIAAGPGGGGVPRAPRGTVTGWPFRLSAALAAILAIALLALLRRSPPPPDPVRFSVPLPAGVSITTREVRPNIAVSPNGRYLAVSAENRGATRLWLRPLDGAATQPLAGTEGAVSPFWSPDSRYIGFTAGGTIKKIALAGGPPQVIADAPVTSVPTWNQHGTILFAMADGDVRGIFRVSENGGPITAVTTVDHRSGEYEHYWPSFLPDGQHFLLLASRFEPNSEGKKHTVYVGSLDSATTLKRVADVDSRMVYTPPGYVLYVRDGTLLAQRWDPGVQALEGEPLPIGGPLRYLRMTGMAEFSVSDNGVVAYHGGLSISELIWLDRTGRKIGTVESRRVFGSLRLSPDGEHLAVDVADPRTGANDVWMYTLRSGTPTRFTSDPVNARDPVWSHDGQIVFFRSYRAGPPDLYEKRADGTGRATLVAGLEQVQLPEDCSPDGRYLAYLGADRVMGYNLWLRPLSGTTTPRPFLRTSFDEVGATFSPDGRWLAFVSNDLGTAEVYVAPVEGTGAETRRRVSTAGGVAPRWRRDGTELFYVSPDDRVMAVPLSRGPAFEAGPPRALFAAGALAKPTGLLNRAAYDVSPDGQRFIVNHALEDVTTSPVSIVLNWRSLARPRGQ